MKLTEAKLKQMILEALKKSSFRSFGIPTPDEKLKSKLGDENFDKIQSLDKEQADIMKQSFDPNYPRDVKQETIEDFMESIALPLEFEEYDFYYPHNIFKIEMYIEGSKMFTVSYYIQSGRTHKGHKAQYAEYSFDYLDTQKIPPRSIKHQKRFALNDMFVYDMEKEEDAKTISSLILLKEKENIKKIIGTK